MELSGLEPKVAENFPSPAHHLEYLWVGVGLTHGCKSVPKILFVNNAIAVLVNYSEGLWRAGWGEMGSPTAWLQHPHP